MKASPWEKDDAVAEGIPILNWLEPQEVLHNGGRLLGMRFRKVRAETAADGRRRLVPTGEPDEIHECDEILVAIGQENAFPWIEPATGIAFDRWGLPVLGKATLQSTNPRVFFGGDAAFGPKNIIWAVAHGHEAAVSIDLFCRGEDVGRRPAPLVVMSSQKMGIHQWSYDNDVSIDLRFKVPMRDTALALQDIRTEATTDLYLRGFGENVWSTAMRDMAFDVGWWGVPPLMFIFGLLAQRLLIDAGRTRSAVFMPLAPLALLSLVLSVAHSLFVLESFATAIYMCLAVLLIQALARKFRGKAAARPPKPARARGRRAFGV
jgi:hypothetical protein